MNLAGAETRPYPLAVVERGRGRRLAVRVDAGATRHLAVEPFFGELPAEG